MAMHAIAYPVAALAAQSYETPGPSPGQGLMIVLIVTILAVAAFLILHLLVTTLLLGRPYEFPVRITRGAVKYCPHCGKEINRRA